MPKNPRVAKTAHPHARSAEEEEAAWRGEVANRNHRDTRRNRGDHVFPAADPQIPAELWTGGRPSWNKPVATLRQELIDAAGTDLCCKPSCNEIGDEIDHRQDWRTYVYRNVSPIVVEVVGGYWDGYPIDKVKDFYNDKANLQLMCGTHNSQKSGPKFYDLDRPSFKRDR